jgi:hypothetical protein
MISLFFEKTWFLWWMFAVVIILRWFHVLWAGADIDVLEEVNSYRDESRIGSEQLASRS